MITPYLYVPLLAWVIAQGIKVSIEIIKGDADFKYLYASCGMTSAHSAVVCSLAGYTFYHQGISSPLFGVTAILAGIVMYDSFGVRRSSGEQAKTINRLIEEMTNNGTLRKPDDYNRLREILGHQPLEVIVGAILGGLVATLFSLDQLDPIIKWLTSTASRMPGVSSSAETKPPRGTPNADSSTPKTAIISKIARRCQNKCCEDQGRRQADYECCGVRGGSGSPF